MEMLFCHWLDPTYPAMWHRSIRRYTPSKFDPLLLFRLDFFRVQQLSQAPLMMLNSISEVFCRYTKLIIRNIITTVRYPLFCNIPLILNDFEFMKLLNKGQVLSIHRIGPWTFKSPKARYLLIAFDGVRVQVSATANHSAVFP